jgi:hypothetical protein
MPYENIDLRLDPIECHKNSDAKFVRIAGLPGGSDIKTYDCANLFIAGQGQTSATTVLGELHVRYTVILSDPIILGQLGVPTNNSLTQLIDSKQALTTATPYQPLLAAAGTTALAVTNGCGVVNTAGSIVPPLGNYMLTVSGQFYSSAGVFSVCYLNILKNAVVQNPGTDGNTCEFYNSAALTRDMMLSTTIFVSCNGTDAITLSGYGVFGSGTSTLTTVFVLIAV